MGPPSFSKSHVVSCKLLNFPHSKISSPTSIYQKNINLNNNKSLRINYPKKQNLGSINAATFANVEFISKHIKPEVHYKPERHFLARQMGSTW